MDERLLEMYACETSTPENQQQPGQLFELDSTAALEQSALVRDDAGRWPGLRAFESSEEGEELLKKQMAEQCGQTRISNIKNNSTLNLFNCILFQIEQIEEYQESDPSPGTSQQHDATTKPSSYNKKNTDSWLADSQ